MTRLPRTCSATGFRLLPATGGEGYKVGKTIYNPLTALTRSPDQHRDEWSRYDVVLRQTVYLAETRECAYAEVLASFKRPAGSDDPLAKDAEALGMSVEEFIEEIAAEWAERDFMGLGSVPAGWRHDRGMYVIELPSDGWWIDIEHPDSIAALEVHGGSTMRMHDVTALTTAHLRGDNRSLTTTLAEYAYRAPLDDGTYPRGIHFGSKHGAYWCKAVLMEEGNNRPGDLLALSPEPILVTDSDLERVASRYRIRVF